MSDLLLENITTVGEFLAHALELEVESAQRYRELADCMEVHNNPEVAALFRRLADYGDRHAADVRQRAATWELPAISPWDFKWCCPEGPESPPMEDAHYLMNRREALELALYNESRGRDFYSQVATRSPNSDVQRIATEMAGEENTHVEMLKRWLARIEDDPVLPNDDLDPPHMPE